MDISTITSISLDLAGRNASFQGQDEISNITLFLLEKGYSIYLFSSDQNDNLDKEYFEHPRLNFIMEPVTADDPRLDDHPELTSEHAFWVTDNPKLQSWLTQNRIRFAYTVGAGAFGEFGFKIGSIVDLSGLFNTSSRVLREIVESIHPRRQRKGEVPFLIGVGGPPMSGFQQFAIDVKRHLEEIAYPLVDLIDLSSLLANTEAVESASQSAELWISPSVGQWVMDSILSPLHAGKRVFVESLPADVPDVFAAHVPLFIGEESLVVVMGQTVFNGEVRNLLDYSILLEVSARETARRLYEIPESEHFDERFVNQYLEHQGRIYKDYLDAHSVKANMLARVNAEHAGALSLNHLAVT